MEAITRLTLPLGLALASCEGGGAGPQDAGRSARPPLNVVLIVIDTLRADAVFDPGDEYDTPNLDRLASEGVAFERAFSAAPMTLPAHMSLFSSRPVHETGVYTNAQPVPTDLPLLAEWLAQQGYDTRAVNSLGTLAVMEEPRTPARGFAVYDSDYTDIALAEATFERLRARLAERDPAKPLFLFAHFADPHEPYESHGTEAHQAAVTMDGAPLARLQTADMHQWRETVELGGGRTVFEIRMEEPRRRFRVRQFECLDAGQHVPLEWETGKLMALQKSARLVVDRGDQPVAPCELRIWINDAPPNHVIRRRYALEVAYADRYVGELIAELERLGLYQESLILFTSDHGEGLGEKGGVGHVENLSDGLIRVPLVIKLPEGDPREAALRAAATTLVSHVDLVPTLLEVAGLPALPGQRGTSLFTPRETIHVAQTSRPEANQNQLAFRDERFKMVYFPDEERFELYDLAEDPGERKDVFATRAAEREAWPGRMRELYRGGRPPAETLDEAARAARDDQLKALGYGGDGD
jgi:arylsulfatase